MVTDNQNSGRELDGLRKVLLAIAIVCVALTILMIVVDIFFLPAILQSLGRDWSL